MQDVFTTQGSNGALVDELNIPTPAVERTLSAFLDLEVLKSIRTNPQKELGGIEVDLETWKLVTRRAGGANEAWERRRDEILIEKQGQLRALAGQERALMKAERDANKQAWAETCIVSWTLTWPDGEPVEVTREFAIGLLSSNPDQMNKAYNDAATYTLFRDHEIAETSKN